ncbi:uncharacterized protein LOC143433487 [Xylocopa sonorina]|uniref:uncharacterized protein LOC143433487 n=1 Tax=Xylocopa sonorina TaxID=1818115 RepID=UPI00403AF3BE
MLHSVASREAHATVQLSLEIMRHWTASFLFVLCGLCVARQADCYSILAIIAIPSYSHQIPYQRLWMELCERGHKVVLITTHPMTNYQSPNFTQISVNTSASFLKTIDFVQMRFSGKTWMDIIMNNMCDISIQCAEEVYKASEMLYASDSNATFDLVMTELFYMPSLFAFAHRFDAPLIGLCSLGMLGSNEHALGGAVFPSHEYTWEMETRTGANLPFSTRLWNFVIFWRYIYLTYRQLYPTHQQLAKRYMGEMPPLLDMLKNISLIFVDQSNVIAPVRPWLPNIVTFTSSHINEKPAPLQKDIQQFLDEAEDGFIYFSLGSNVKSSNLSKHMKDIMCEVFAKLPYRIVWKYEMELSEKPANVYTAKWFDQQSILAHPNIKLFIYQGGLQSSEETIHFAVPVVVMPVFADQDYQARRMEALGIGRSLEITTLTKDEFESAILEVITNQKYKEKVNHVRSLLKDVPQNMVKNVAWWTEYVIRTKGAPHLRSNLAWLPWYQRYDTDIIVFLTIVALLVLLNVINVTARLLVYVRKRSTNQKQKIKPKITSTASYHTDRSTPASNMKFTVAIVLLGLCILSVPKQSKAARILIVYSLPLYSHQVPFLPLWAELTKRGHELVIIGFHSVLDANSTNIREITISLQQTERRRNVHVQDCLNGMSYMTFVENTMMYLMSGLAHYTFNNTEVKKLYAPDSGEKFDLVMVEMFLSYPWFALAHRFNAPVIGLNTLGLLAVDSYVLGDMVVPSHDSTWELETNTGENLPFWNRLKNFYTVWRFIYIVQNHLIPIGQKVAEQYFGTELPQVVDIMANTSVVFLNVDHIMSYARPEVPNIIRFHAVHNAGEPKPLPQDIQSFVDDAPNGFIYFCMGTTVQFLDLFEETQQIFYDVFADLPYKIVWKLEKPPLRKLSNVYTSPWLPQRSVLAHPNVKLYMYHGGAMSTQEAIHYGVPVLGFPIFSDQERQIKKLKSLGVGNRLNVRTLTRESLNSTIRETISNKVYKQNMMELRTLLQDKQHDWVKDLAWWTEYVIRNKGAPHLRSNLASQPWYTYYDMDIVVFLTVIAVVICITVLSVCLKLCTYASKRNQQIRLSSEKKVN